MKKIFLFTVCSIVFYFAQASAVTHVVTVLDSTDPHIVGKTMKIAKKNLLHHPGQVTIIFDDKAIQLLDTREVPIKLSNGKTLHQEVRDFIESGGNAAACSKCMRRLSNLRPKDMVKGTGLSAEEPVSKLDKAKTIRVDYYYK